MQWGFWDWLAYIGLFVVALQLMLDNSLKNSGSLKVLFAPMLASDWWNRLPLTLLMFSSVIFLVRAFVLPVGAPGSPAPTVTQLETPPAPPTATPGPMVPFGPDYLLDMIKQRTMAESAALLNVYRGRELEAAGVFQSMGMPFQDRATILLVFNPSGPNGRPQVIGCTMIGDAAKDAPRIALGRLVRVRGQITGEIALETVYLEPCQVVALE